MSRKQCRPPDPRPTTRRTTVYARDLFLSLSLSSPLREFPLPSTRSLSLSLSLFPSTDVDYKFSRPAERQRHESPDPRRDCEIEKRCRRTRRADSRPHHGPTPPPTKSPSQGRSPTSWPVMSLGETQQEFSPLFLSLSLFLPLSSLHLSILPLAPLQTGPVRLFPSLSPSLRRWISSLLAIIDSLSGVPCLSCDSFFSSDAHSAPPFSASFLFLRNGNGMVVSFSLSLSLSLFLCAPLFVVPLAVLAPPPSSSRFVNRSLRCTRADSYIYHALLSSLLLLGREAPCSVHALAIFHSSTSPDSFLLLLFLLLLLLLFLLLFYTIAVAAVSRMILSIFVVVESPT